MTLVGKIFVVAILIMSVVYMGFAMAVYSARVNWYEEIHRTEAKPGEKVGYKVQLENLETEKKNLSLELDQLQKQLAVIDASHRQQLSKLETERKELLAQNQALETQRDQLVQANRTLSVAVDTKTQELKRLTEEVHGLRQEIRDTQLDRDKVFAALVAKTDELHDTQGKLVVLKERETQLTQQVALYHNVLKENEIDPTKYNLGTNPPRIAGVVTGVKENELIEISIGDDDGIRPGHTLEVFRAKTYLGRVEVLHTAPDRAVAKVIKELLRGEIQKGDRVATKLKLS